MRCMVSSDSRNLPSATGPLREGREAPRTDAAAVERSDDCGGDSNGHT